MLSSHNSKCTCYQPGLSLMVLPSLSGPAVFARFLSCEVIFFPIFMYSTLIRQVSKCSQHSRSEQLKTASLGEEYLRKLFGILLYGKLLPSSSLVYLFNNLFILGWIQEYLFYTFDFNLRLQHLYSLNGFGYGESFQVGSCPFDNLYHFLSASLLPGTIRCSKLISNISCSSPRINYFFKESWFLLL